MKDYTQGAFEALCWVKQLLKGKTVEQIAEELEGALEHLLYGFFVDFDAKIRRGY